MKRNDPLNRQTGKNAEHQSLFGEKGMERREAVTTPLYSHSDDRTVPVVSMVCKQGLFLICRRLRDAIREVYLFKGEARNSKIIQKLYTHLYLFSFW